MTQILAYCCPEGIVLGTDSRAQHYQQNGSVTSGAVHKLFPLCPRLLLATAGAGYGIALSRAFQNHVQRKNLWQFDEVCYQALPFFRSERERLKHEGRLPVQRQDLARVYFLLAGQNLACREQPFQLHLLGSEQHDEPLRRIPVREILAIPRQLGLESRLSRLRQEHQALARIRAVMKRFLVQLSKTSPDVGPPLHVVSINREGIRTDRFPPKAPRSGSRQLES